MINIITAWETCQAEIRALQYGGINDTEFNRFWNQGEAAVYDIYANEYQLTGVISDKFRTFQGIQSYLPNVVDGTHTYPADYFRGMVVNHIASLSQELPVEYVIDDKWGARSRSVAIDLDENPIWNKQNDFFRVLPFTISPKLYYTIKMIPATLVMSFATGSPVPDPLLSVNSMFDEALLPELVAAAVAAMAKSIQKQM